MQRLREGRRHREGGRHPQEDSPNRLPDEDGDLIEDGDDEDVDDIDIEDIDD